MSEARSMPQEQEEQVTSTANLGPLSMGQRGSLQPQTSCGRQIGGRSMNGRTSVNGSSGLGVRASSAVSKLRLAAASLIEREPPGSASSTCGSQTTSMRLQTLANQVTSSEAVLRQLEEAIAMSRATKLHEWTEGVQSTELDPADMDAVRELGPWAGSKRAPDRPPRPTSTRPWRPSPRVPTSAQRMRARAARVAASVDAQAGAVAGGAVHGMTGDSACGLPAADAGAPVDGRSRAAHHHATIFKFSASDGGAQPAEGPPSEDGPLEAALSVTRMRVPVPAAPHSTAPLTCRSTEAAVVQAAAPGQLAHDSSAGAASPRHTGGSVAVCVTSAADAGPTGYASPVDSSNTIAPAALGMVSSTGDVGSPRPTGNHCHLYEFELPRPPTGRSHMAPQGGQPLSRAESGSCSGAVGPMTPRTGHPAWLMGMSGWQSPAQPGSPLHTATTPTCKQPHEPGCTPSSEPAATGQTGAALSRPVAGIMRGWSSELAGPECADSATGLRAGGRGRRPSAPAPAMSAGGAAVGVAARGGSTGSVPHMRPRSPAEPLPLVHMSSLPLAVPQTATRSQAVLAAATTAGSAPYEAPYQEPTPPGPLTPPSASPSPRWAGYVLAPPRPPSSNDSSAAAATTGHAPVACAVHAPSHSSEPMLPAVAGVCKEWTAGGGAAAEAEVGAVALGGFLKRLAHQPFWLHASSGIEDRPCSSPASMTATTLTNMSYPKVGCEDRLRMAVSCTHTCSQGKPLHPTAPPSSYSHSTPSAHHSELLRPAAAPTTMRSRSGPHSAVGCGGAASTRPGSSLTRLLRASVESLQQLVPRDAVRPQTSHASWSAGGASGHGALHGNSHARGHGGHGEVALTAHTIHVPVGSGVGGVAPIAMAANGAPARFAWAGRQ